MELIRLRAYVATTPRGDVYNFSMGGGAFSGEFYAVRFLKAEMLTIKNRLGDRRVTNKVIIFSTWLLN